MDHPTPETLSRYLRGQLREEEEERLKAHLRDDRCEECLFAVREGLPQVDFDLKEGSQKFVRAMYRKREDESVDMTEGSEAFQRGFEQAMRRGFVLDCERTLGLQLLQELEKRPSAARRELIRTTERYQLYGLVEALCDASRKACFSDVVRAIELGELAVEVADSLDPAMYIPIFVADQRGFTRAVLGNARRVGSDLFGADRAFEAAEPFFERGTLVSPVRSEYLRLLGSLRIDQARYEEARRVLEKAFESFWGDDERQERTRVLLQLGLCAGYSGDAEKAVELFSQAVELSEGLEDQRLVLSAHHNLADWTVETGDSLEALARFEKAQPLYARFAEDPWVQLRRRWAEGRIHAGLGDYEVAQRAFEEVRALAARRELGYELAMVSLDLAIVHLDQGDVARVQDLAEELAPVFRSQQLHGHALAAMYMFRQAARAERASAGFAREVVRYLQRARNNPYLRFEPSARWV